MELHLVHFNALAGSSVPDAMNNSKAFDTLAVISILFEIKGEDNPAIHPITEGNRKSNTKQAALCRLIRQ